MNLDCFYSSLGVLIVPDYKIQCISKIRNLTGNHISLYKYIKRLHICNLKVGGSNLKRLKTAFIYVLLALFLSCQSVQIKTANPNMPINAYLDGGKSTVGVILCHGRGQYPTWRVVDPLRKGIHEQLGYHTLSLQMPTADVDWHVYRNYFPNAYKRIGVAIQVLRNEKGVETIYLMGHGMGSWIAAGYLSENSESNISGFIGVGIRYYNAKPIDSRMTLQIAMQKSPHLKVLDVYGDGGEGIDAFYAKNRSFLVSDRYKQILIPGADHQFFTGEKEMVSEVINWLKEQETLTEPSS